MVDGLSAEVQNPVMPYNIWSDPTPLAGPDDYKKALLAVRMTDRQKAMLQAQCNSPNHAASSHYLVLTVRYKTYDAANAQYGRLAHKIADALRITLPPTSRRDPHWPPETRVNHSTMKAIMNGL